MIAPLEQRVVLIPNRKYFHIIVALSCNKLNKQNINNQEDKELFISVLAPARLHLGFIDMHGGMGRSFGSLGLCLDEIFTHLVATASRDVIIQGPSSGRASVYAGKILEYLGEKQGVKMVIKQAIPEHAGLGSGTQLSLAVGTAIANIYDMQLGIRKIAEIMDRGTRSGIGVGAFSMGGFLVDGGRGNNTQVPPIISHIYFPDSWRVLLVFDHDETGVHGKLEKLAFQQLPPMDQRVTEYLCRLTLMQILPALAEQDCEQFGSAITEIQQQVGDHFSKAQGGRFCSEQVAKVLPQLLEHGATGIGQSSWGPTGFAIFANETQAHKALKHFREAWKDHKSVSFKVCKARNEKALINKNIQDNLENINYKSIS